MHLCELCLAFCTHQLRCNPGHHQGCSFVLTRNAVFALPVKLSPRPGHLFGTGRRRDESCGGIHYVCHYIRYRSSKNQWKQNKFWKTWYFYESFERSLYKTGLKAPQIDQESFYAIPLMVGFQMEQIIIPIHKCALVFSYNPLLVKLKHTPIRAS